eukprot:6181830-Pleurochrysis_carterae.AAC.1
MVSATQLNTADQSTRMMHRADRRGTGSSREGSTCVSGAARSMVPTHPSASPAASTVCARSNLASGSAETRPKAGAHGAYGTSTHP